MVCHQLMRLPMCGLGLIEHSIGPMISITNETFSSQRDATSSKNTERMRNLIGIGNLAKGEKRGRGKQLVQLAGTDYL